MTINADSTRRSIIATGLVVIMAASGAVAAEEWTRQSPYPADADLESVYFTSAS